MWIKLVKSINTHLINFVLSILPRPKVASLTNLSNGPKATTALNMQKGAKFTIVCTIFLRIGLNSKS